MSNEWPINENEKEISLEEKKKFISAWQELVLCSEKSYNEECGLSDEKIKNWMYESMMEDIDNLCDEWKINFDQNLAELIRKEEDVEIKAELELEYIKSCHDKIDDLVKNFDKSKSTRWDSWPKKMKESGQFNCVGASLLGMNLINKAGIENYWGNPVGHVVNIVKLSNGDWWYVDFLNGPGNVRKIEPEEGKIKEADVLRIDNPRIDYKIIPIYSKKEATGSILGNLDSLNYEAGDEKSLYSKDKKEAQDYLKKYRKYFSEVNFREIQDKFFKKQSQLRESKEIKEERVRVMDIHSFFEGAVRDYVDSLNREQISKCEKDKEKYQRELSDFFYKDDRGVLNIVCVELRNFLELYEKALSEIKIKDVEKYEEIVGNFLNKN